LHFIFYANTRASHAIKLFMHEGVSYLNAYLHVTERVYFEHI